MAFEIDIASLYERAFGAKAQKFDTSQLYPNTVFQHELPSEIDTSKLYPNKDTEGTEFLNMRNALKSALPTGQFLFMPIQIGGLLLPNEPSIFLQTKKTIVETALVGSSHRGTVKEMIGFEDWDITIRGIAINYYSNRVYPEDQVSALNELYNRNEALSIECALTALLGITRVIIKEFELVEMIGVQHAQAYQFKLVSDEDFVLEIL